MIANQRVMERVAILKSETKDQIKSRNHTKELEFSEKKKKMDEDEIKYRHFEFHFELETFKLKIFRRKSALLKKMHEKLAQAKQRRETIQGEKKANMEKDSAKIVKDGVEKSLENRSKKMELFHQYSRKRRDTIKVFENLVFYQNRATNSINT